MFQVRGDARGDSASSAPTSAPPSAPPSAPSSGPGFWTQRLASAGGASLEEAEDTAGGGASWTMKPGDQYFRGGAGGDADVFQLRPGTNRSSASGSYGTDSRPGKLAHRYRNNNRQITIQK